MQHRLDIFTEIILSYYVMLTLLAISVFRTFFCSVFLGTNTARNYMHCLLAADVQNLLLKYYVDLSYCVQYSKSPNQRSS